jgi:hypothetical protein
MEILLINVFHVSDPYCYKKINAFLAARLGFSEIISLASLALMVVFLALLLKFAISAQQVIIISKINALENVPLLLFQQSILTIIVFAHLVQMVV